MQARGVSLAVLALATLGARPAHSECAFVELGPEPITRTGAKIPADGGILVGVGRSTDHKPPKGDPSQAVYKASSGGKSVSLVTASLAPGLTVYRPKPAIVGALALQSGKTQVLSVTFDKAKAHALPAPVASAVTVTSEPGPRGEVRTTVTAAVGGVPDAAVALIVYAMKDEEHVPITFGTPAHDKTGATTVLVYAAGGHCSGPTLANQVAPAKGDEVSLAWVDAYGRLSPVSAAITAN